MPNPNLYNFDPEKLKQLQTGMFAPSGPTPVISRTIPSVELPDKVIEEQYDPKTLQMQLLKQIAEKKLQEQNNDNVQEVYPAIESQRFNKLKQKIGY